jgi:hypothetical protein
MSRLILVVEDQEDNRQTLRSPTAFETAVQAFLKDYADSTVRPDRNRLQRSRGAIRTKY